jgi:fido (protein-threonine AMPylation protein)
LNYPSFLPSLVHACPCSASSRGSHWMSSISVSKTPEESDNPDSDSDSESALKLQRARWGLPFRHDWRHSLRPFWAGNDGDDAPTAGQALRVLEIVWDILDSEATGTSQGTCASGGGVGGGVGDAKPEPLAEELELLAGFQRRSFLLTAYESCKLEGTLPADGSETGILKAAEELLGGAPHDAVFPSPWPCEGATRDAASGPRPGPGLGTSTSTSTATSTDGPGGLPEGAQQIAQHVKALMYLRGRSGRNLSTAVVKEAHRILLMGAVEEDGRPAENGELRTIGVYAGTHQFPSLSVEAIHRELDGICGTFVKRLHSDEHPIVTAANLAQEVVALHPFRNGNGRMCRLLFMAALVWQGLPFGVTLTSGRSKSRQHYLAALQHAQNRLSDSRLDHLHYMALHSVYMVLSNFYSCLQYCSRRSL